MAKRRWRDYRTAAGRRPIKEFLEALDDEEVAAVTTAMKEVKDKGLRAARHLGNAIYEVRAPGNQVTYRLLFAPQGEAESSASCARAFQKEDPEDTATDDPPGRGSPSGLGEARRGT
jgi:hypothetical protein